MIEEIRAAALRERRLYLKDNRVVPELKITFSPCGLAECLAEHQSYSYVCTESEEILGYKYTVDLRQAAPFIISA